MPLRSSFGSLVAAALLAACGPSTATVPGPGPDTLAPGNSSALLTGARLGRGSAPASELRKDLQLTPAGPATGLVLDRAWALRRDVASQAIYLVGHVRNASQAGLCFVSFDSLVLRDEAGAAVAERDLGYVHGSVGVVSSGDYTTTCLAPGETGRLTDIVLTSEDAAAYSRAARVEVAFSTETEWGATPPQKVLPTGYSVVGEQLQLAFRNDGTEAALVVNGFHQYVLYDEAELPVSWGFFRGGVSPTGPLAPGASGSAFDDLSPLDLDGAADRMWALVDFADPPEGALTSADLEDPARTEAEVLREWQARERRAHLRSGR